MKETVAAIYARTSTVLEQDPQLQVTTLQEVASNRGFSISDIYIDQISGVQSKRPALDRMLMDARRGKFKLILVTGIDRIGRNTKHILSLFEELRYLGIHVFSLRENLDFTTPVGQMVLTVMASIAQLERQILAERIKTALAAKKVKSEKEGSNWRCGRPPIPADLKRKALDLRDKGMSVRRIAKQLGIGKTSVERAIRGKR